MAVACLLAIALPGSIACAAAAKPELSPRDRSAIAAAACNDAPAADGIVASPAKGARNVIEVRCPPHGALGRSPLVHHATCARSRGAWHCDAGYEAIHVTLPDSTVLPVVADKDIPPLQAVVLIIAASKQIVPPFHTPAISMMRGQCSIAPHPQSPSPDMRQFDIRCEGTSMLLTKHCGKTGCRYFIPQGEGY